MTTVNNSLFVRMQTGTVARESHAMNETGARHGVEKQDHVALLLIESATQIGAAPVSVAFDVSKGQNINITA